MFSCSRWGRHTSDCQSVNWSAQSTSEEVPTVVVNDTIELEGFSSKETTGKASKEIVTMLIAELESMFEKESLSGSRFPRQCVAGEESTDIE